MGLSVAYTPCATSSSEKTCDIITFAQFEESNLLSEPRNDAESGDKYNEYSIITTLLIEEEMGAMDSGEKSDHDPISTEMLKDICDKNQSRPNINKREASYKICDRNKQIQS